MKLTLAGYHGLLRLWVLCAVLWIAGTFGLSWYLDHARPAADEILVGVVTRADCDARAKSDKRVNAQTCYERLDQRTVWQHTERLIWAFAPPILLLPIVAGAMWVINGFRRDRT